MLGELLSIVDKFIPDGDKRAEAKAQLLEAIGSVDKAQAEINKEDAKSDRFIQYGWRPTLAWLSIMIVFWGYFGVDFVNTLAVNSNPNFQKFPNVDPTLMIALLGKLLGFGVYRTAEKIKRGGVKNALKGLIG